MATAKSVIDSAKRLIERRHSWRVSTRIEEISVPPLPLEPAHLRVCAIEVAEGDRARRAGGLASGDDLTDSIASVPLHRPASPADALDAVGALLHHAAGADRHFRVLLRLERLGA